MILSNLEQFQKAMPTAIALENWSDIETYAESAELWIHNEVLGKTLYTVINADSFADETILRLCRNIIANHAFYEAIPFLDLVLDNNGFGVVSNKNLAPASKERVERLMQQCLKRRDSETENIIALLEADSTYHDDWKGSPSYSMLSDCLITTAAELKRYANWDGTRAEFLRQKPDLVMLTRKKINPIISKNYVDELIEKQRDNDLSSADLEVLDSVKYALGAFISRNNHVGATIVTEALNVINTNLQLYPTYTASSEYKARTTPGYENSADSSVFSSVM